MTVEAGLCRLIEVRVRDFRLAARIGAFPHEMGREQTLHIAVTLTLTSTPADRLEATVDYVRIVAHATQLAQQHIMLIETFAHRLAAACLGEPGVIRAEVTVEKPGALVNGIASTRLILDAGAA